VCGGVIAYFGTVLVFSEVSRRWHRHMLGCVGHLHDSLNRSILLAWRPHDMPVRVPTFLNHYSYSQSFDVKDLFGYQMTSGAYLTHNLSLEFFFFGLSPEGL